jgi:hypothetical protein
VALLGGLEEEAGPFAGGETGVVLGGVGGHGGL